MTHFNDAKYRGPGAGVGKSSEGEVKGSGVDSYKPVKGASDEKDKRTSDYRGPAGKLTSE